MASQALLIDALQLTAVGMTAVFAFLTLLVLVTSVSSKLILATNKSQKMTTKSGSSLPLNTPPNITAIIAAAIHQYRQQH